MLNNYVLPIDIFSDLRNPLFSAECTIGMGWGVGVAKGVWQ